VGERIGRWGWVGLALGLAGAALAIFGRSAVAVENTFGVVMTFLALLGITAGTLYEKRFGVTHHPVSANLIQYAVGAGFCLPAAWLSESMAITWDAEFIWVMAYLVLANSLLAMSLLLAMIRAGEVARVSSLFYLVPALAALCAWPLLGEVMPPAAWAGMALAGLGVALAAPSAHAAAASQPEVDASQQASLFSNSLGLSFPLLQNPGTQLFNFLFDGEADLVVWDIPDLDAGFDFRQSFPIFPPLFVSLFGGVEFKTNFDLGYDTRGLRMAMAEGGSAEDLLLGVYLVDEGRQGLGLGSDDPEMSVTAEIGAGAELNVVVAKAGVDGGLRGTLGADLNDPDPDGKVYVDELAYNLMRGPQCIFDLQGSLDVFLEAYIKVGLDTPFGFITLFSDRFKLVEATILDWSLVVCPPLEPNLADLSGTTLTLNMGALAVNVVPGETTDGDETFLID
jgi:uncharacterized membrane protein